MRIALKWRVIVVLCLFAGLNYADRTAISSVFPLIRADLGLSDLAMGATGSFFLWSYAICSPLAGVLSDRASRSKVVVWSLTCWSLVTLSTGFVHSVEALLTCRVLLGISECAYLPAAIALIADHHGPETRATGMGIHLGGMNLGMIAGGVSAGYLGETFGWRVNFWILGLAGLLMALTGRHFLQDPTAKEPVESLKRPLPGLGHVMSLFRYLTIDALLIEGMLMSCGAWMFYNWLPLFFKETYRLSLASAGFAGTAIFQLAATIGIVLGGYMSDRIAKGNVPRRLLLLAGSYLAAAPCLAMFALRPGMGLISSAIFTYALLTNFGSANEHPLMCDVLPPKMRSTAIALMNTASCVAGGLGVMIAAYLKRDWGLGAVFGGVNVFAVTSAGVVFGAFLLARRTRDKLVTQQGQAAG